MNRAKIFIGRIQANIVTALLYDSTRPMRVFIIAASTVLAVWLLLPGKSIGRVEGSTLGMVFHSDEVMALFPLAVVVIKVIAEGVTSQRFKVFAAFAAAVWWGFIAGCAFWTRFNSLAGALWMLLAAASFWVAYRRRHENDF